MKLSIFLANIFLKYNMNIEMILVGLILFSGMAAAGVKIWLNKRKEKETTCSILIFNRLLHIH